jgi:hypothetical protein
LATLILRVSIPASYTLPAKRCINHMLSNSCFI